MVDITKKIVQNCVLNQPDQKNSMMMQRQLQHISFNNNFIKNSMPEITSDPVIRLDEEQEASGEEVLPGSEDVQQQAPALSSKKQAKLEKKKQAKQNAKLKEQQMK